MIKEIFETILALVGVFSVVYTGAYFVELAKQKVRRKMRVCDNCFEVIKRIKDGSPE